MVFPGRYFHVRFSRDGDDYIKLPIKWLFLENPDVTPGGPFILNYNRNNIYTYEKSVECYNNLLESKGSLSCFSSKHIDRLSSLLVGNNSFSFSDSAESTFDLSLNAGATYAPIDKDNPSSWWRRRSDLEHRVDTVAFGSLSDFKSLFYGEVKGHTVKG